MRVSLLLSIPFALMLSGEALAQCRVEGVVLQVDGTPLAGAIVRLEEDRPEKPLTTTTDAEGHYVFETVTPGMRVRVVAIASGHLIDEEYTLVTRWIERVDLQERAVPALSTNPQDVVASEGSSAGVEGVVRTADGLPVPAARITVNDTALATTTDSAGRYAFVRLRPGMAIRLRASAAGSQPATSEVIVPQSGQLAADFELASMPAEQARDARLPSIELPVDASVIPLSPEQAAGSPTLARKDIVRTLQLMPGVAGSLEDSAGLAVRGGTPDETLVTLDGFTLYNLDNVFATYGSYNMEAIRSGELFRTASSAAEGGRLSGALRLEGASNPAGKATGFFGLSMLGTEGLISMPFANKGSFLFAMRRSLPATLYNDVLDAFAGGAGTPARDRIARYSSGTLDASPASSFHDLNGKVDLRLTGTDTLAVSVYDAHNNINDSRDLTLTAPSAGLHAVEGTELPSDLIVEASDIRNWKARGASGEWTHEWRPSVSTTLSFGHSSYSKGFDFSWLLAQPSTGVDYSFLAYRGGSNALTEANDVGDTTVRLSGAVDLGFEHALSMGGEVSSLDVDYSAQTEAFRVAAGGGGLTSSLVKLLEQQTSGRSVTVFAQDTWRPLPLLIVSPGVRVAHVGSTGSTLVEPRVSAAYQLTSTIRFSGAWGIDHQAITRITREDRMHGDGQFWALADGAAIPVPSAQQVAAGATLGSARTVFDVEAYYKKLDDLTLCAPRLFPGVAPAAGASVLSHGSGTARGLDMFLQNTTSRNTLWVSYSVSRAEYTYPTLETAAYPASQDQTHEFKVMDTALVATRWWLSGAWVLASGRPYTPAESISQVWLPTGDMVYQVMFGPKNSARLPVYHRLDMSTEREFRVGAFRSTLGVTVFNVFDRKNLRFRDYEAAGDSYTTTDVLFMGRAVNVFAKVGF